MFEDLITVRAVLNVGVSGNTKPSMAVAHVVRDEAATSGSGYVADEVPAMPAFEQARRDAEVQPAAGTHRASVSLSYIVVFYAGIDTDLLKRQKITDFSGFMQGLSNQQMWPPRALEMTVMTCQAVLLRV